MGAAPLCVAITVPGHAGAARTRSSRTHAHALPALAREVATRRTRIAFMLACERPAAAADAARAAPAVTQICAGARGRGKRSCLLGGHDALCQPARRKAARLMRVPHACLRAGARLLPVAPRALRQLCGKSVPGRPRGGAANRGCLCTLARTPCRPTADSRRAPSACCMWGWVCEPPHGHLRRARCARCSKAMRACRAAPQLPADGAGL
jgi:hypothetical protein